MHEHPREAVVLTVLTERGMPRPKTTVTDALNEVLDSLELSGMIVGWAYAGEPHTHVLSGSRRRVKVPKKEE